METYVASLAEKMSLKDTARVVGLDWKTVKQIDRVYLKSLLPDISQMEISRIAMDEIAVMKGHKYVTIIRDYDTGVVIRTFMGRRYEDTASALQTLGTGRLACIQYVSLDMWDPYIKAVREKCPNARFVFDKFHVVKKINEALDHVRRNEFANACEAERIHMKRKRYLILSREANLKPQQQEDLEKLVKKNERLHKAYLLKEQILSIFDDTTSTLEQVKERISIWFSNVLSNDIEEFYSVVDTMRSYLYGILNHFKYHMTNAIAEGFNTKINVIKRRAYGFRDVEYFMLKIIQSSLPRLA